MFFHACFYRKKFSKNGKHTATVTRGCCFDHSTYFLQNPLDSFVGLGYTKYGTLYDFRKTSVKRGCFMIQRDFYLNQIKERMWDGNIKVITGIRRGGKSTLLFSLFKEYLLSTGVSENHIIEIELDRRKYYKYRDPIVLCDYVADVIEADKENKYYLFIDEVQLTKPTKDQESGIEVTIYDMLNELKAHPNLDCYVTGSNSRMLSSDIATEFRGRSSQIKVYPLSFAEFFSYRGGVVSEALDEYMLYGGMPGLTQFHTAEQKRAYLKNLYDEIYLKDLVEHGRIRREDILEEILDYLASQIGSLTNASKIAAFINTKVSAKIDEGLVARYVKQTMDAFLISEAKRYDVKGKKYFDYPNKYYYSDVGLRNIRLNYRQIDPGHMMEHLIYCDLIRRGYSVDVGVVEEWQGNDRKTKEIDFIVNNTDRRIYIQSALRMDEQAKADTELASLKLTGDFFKKIVVRHDIPTSFYDEDGILHASLSDLLLDRVELF